MYQLLYLSSYKQTQHSKHRTAFLGNYDRPTNQQTDTRVHRGSYSSNKNISLKSGHIHSYINVYIYIWKYMHSYVHLILVLSSGLIYFKQDYLSRVCPFAESHVGQGRKVTLLGVQIISFRCGASLYPFFHILAYTH